MAINPIDFSKKPFLEKEIFEEKHGILILDDNLSNLLIYNRILSKEPNFFLLGDLLLKNKSFRGATTVARAYACFEENIKLLLENKEDLRVLKSSGKIIDTFIVDYNLPETKGIELIKKTQGLYNDYKDKLKDLFLTFVSSSQNLLAPEDEETLGIKAEYVKLGVKYFFGKETPPAKIREIVKNAIQATQEENFRNSFEMLKTDEIVKTDPIMNKRSFSLEGDCDLKDLDLEGLDQNE